MSRSMAVELSFCHRLTISRVYFEKNKYGTQTGVAELMCEQLGGDCSRKRLYIVCIIYKLGSVLVCILEFSVRKHCYKLCLGMTDRQTDRHYHV